MPTVASSLTLAIAEALADRVLELADGADELAELQVVAFRQSSPSPPAVDIYPADPSQDDAAFGPRSRQTFWTVRARVATADEAGQQTVLYALMDPSGPTSMMAALLADDQTLDGLADAMNVEGPTGFRLYQDLAVDHPLLGVEWRVTVYTATGAET